MILYQIQTNQITLKGLSENTCSCLGQTIYVCRLAQFSVLSRFLLKHPLMTITTVIIQSGGEQRWDCIYLPELCFVNSNNDLRVNLTDL